ncbi:VOC family protein [Croceicoccus marinus]|uniref:VOC family protein n=1 Tax=Croceicoccus marinus TaxID=450378 RepID=UPI000A0409A6|nr:VOC family protein [Croceicoccus marinus]
MALPPSPIRQIAFFVPDAWAAAHAHHAAHGSGPFLLAENIPLAQATYRGQPAHLDHSSAYGQWGDVMVEFVQQNNPGPSVFHDLYPEGSGRFGPHHTAIFVDDADAAADQWAAAGYPSAFRGVMEDGFVYHFADTTALCGMMTELYAATDQLRSFYDHVAAIAGDFAGHPVVRTIKL